MTLEELKEKIDNAVEMFGEEALQSEVYAAYDYGDHCHTEALTRITDVDLITPRESAYSGSGLAMPHENDDCQEMPDVPEIFVLI